MNNNFIKAKKTYFNNIRFDSTSECRCYQELLKIYPRTEIKVHVDKKLLSFPQNYFTNIDFETPDCYVEFKGNWAFQNRAIITGLKSTYLLFQNKHYDKPFLMVINNRRNVPEIKGIKIVKLSQLIGEINDVIHQRIYS